MKLIEVKYSRNKVDKAGDLLRTLESSSFEDHWTANVLSYWRAIHNYPINTFQATLRNKLKKIDNHALVAQRLKRIPSIIQKLQRFPDMDLSRMQDIGGLRAVVQDIPKLQSLYRNYKKTRFLHELTKEYDYIYTPKRSGYRSIHLVYRYNNPLMPAYNGLLIELQLRTRKQHAWATAVETMGIFLDNALKSSVGPEEWLNFFSLTSSAFAHMEQQNLVPGYEYMTSEETYHRVTKKSKELNVENKLTGFGIAIKAIQSDNRRGIYYLLVLDPKNRTIRYQAYSKERFGVATEDYLKEEEKIVEGSQKQAVLVAAASIEDLKRAYPNFFLDTQEFLKILKRIEEYAKNTKYQN